ncbi:MAG: hypothetical protein P4L90_16705 [Rhodopila sp.]|nr:hypothetical protein [Rhodopila sp.]
MTRISSLFVATTLAILPMSAFAQQNAAPVKDAAPAGITAAAPAATAAATDKVVAGKETSTTTANVAQPTKPEIKTPAHGAKPEVHSLNTVNPHHAKTKVPAKTVEPAKS